MDNRVNTQDFPGETIHRLQHDLRERAKELNCLYGIAHVVDRSGSTLEEMLRGIVDLLPRAWQYPDKACSRITMGTQEFRTDNFRETPFKQASRIAVHGKDVGSVQVFYLEEGPEVAEEPFLKEELRLIEMIAGRLGKLIEQKTAEDVIRKSEEKYRSIFENAVEGIFQTKVGGKFLTVNPSYVKMFGYSSPEEVTSGGIDVGKHIYANPDDRVRFKKLMDERGMVRMFEFPALKKDGTRIWACLNARAAKDATGAILYYEGTIEDVTLLKQAQEALRESEGRYRLLIENSHDIIYTLTPGGVFAFVSPSWTRLLGHPVAQVVGQRFQQFVHPDDVDRCEAFLQKTIETGQRETSVEYRVRHADGSWRWHNTDAGPLRDKAGTIVGFEGCASDITPRKLAEEELKRTMERLRQGEETLSAAINATHESLIMIDREGTVVLSNRIGAQRLGRSVPELVGTCLYDHLPPDVAVSRKEYFDTVFGTAEPVHFEDMRAGRYFESYCYPIADEGGEISRAAIFARDISERKIAEEQLKQQVDAMEASMDGIAILDGDQNYVYVNEAHARIYGYDASGELTGQSWRLLYDENELQRFDHDIMPEFIQKGWWQGEATGRRKDGSSFLQELSLTALDAGGLICIVHDITERKRMRDALKESEEKYRNIFENALEGIFQTTPAGRILSVNPALARICGFDSPQEIMDTFTDIGTQLYVHPEDRVRLEGLLREHGFAERFETQFHKKDGSKVRVSMNIHTVTDTRGNIAFYEGILEDITLRKQAEEDLRSTHRRLSDIIEFLPDATFVIDEEKKVVAWNLACEELTGVRKQDIIGKGEYAHAIPFYGERRPILIDYVTMDPDELQEKYVSIRRKGHRLYAEASVSMPCNATGTYLSGNASPLFDRTGKVVGAIESICDITEVRHLETQLRQAQKMESIGTLAGGIAHDFNNILTSLMGYASLVQMKMDKGNPLQSYVDQILSASEKAADLTRSLLTFSRKQPVALVPLDISDTIRETKRLLKRLLTEDIRLRTSLTKDDTVVMADRSQIDQILFNLVTNARDAMPKGGTLVIETDIADMDDGFIEAHGFGESGRYVLISVSDTGTGMDKTTKEKIFDPFFTTKETGKGTGLGLATVYGIVKQHDGYIAVHSEPDHGTTFRIYLPIVKAEVCQEHHETPPNTTGKETILIAEDNEGARHVMHEALREYGYKTIEAVDGEDALDKFKQHRDVDLVILDSVMPKKNGREVYEEIRRQDPDIKVLFTSGYTRDVVLDKGIEDRKMDFIAKPLSLEKLLQKVREVLDG
ncbi:MAG: PAS domain S-box protein [Syntrophorhabdaceae bacterium]|nr:PAS domain S-box protein [Syntrophorhabdaceae bacterium]